MKLLTGDLGSTAVYSRREYQVLVGLGWPDGRDATAWLLHFKAKRRRGTVSRLSRYAVSEVKEVGFMGRAFVFGKEFPVDEHGDEPNVRQPPYTVKVDQHGSVWCACQAGACLAPTCRHSDLVRVLLDEGAFDGESLQGF